MLFVFVSPIPIMEPEETAVVRQQLNKHVPAAKNTLATIRIELLDDSTIILLLFRRSLDTDYLQQ
jgi:hypothetical protein